MVRRAANKSIYTGLQQQDAASPQRVVPGRAREAYEVQFGDPQCLKMMIDWQA
jgi:hypothetical protein